MNSQNNQLQTSTQNLNGASAELIPAGQISNLSTAVSTAVQPAQATLRLSLSTVDDVRMVAQMAHQSGYCKTRSIDSAAWKLIRGMELGFSPAQAIASMHDIQGILSLSAEGMAAVCKKSPLCKYFQVKESTRERCTVTTHRIGDPEPTSVTYTIEDAKGAGLAGKDVWKAHPAAMLTARATSRLARMVYPDLLTGLYTEDEAREIAENEARNKPKESAPSDAPRPNRLIPPHLREGNGGQEMQTAQSPKSKASEEIAAALDNAKAAFVAAAGNLGIVFESPKERGQWANRALKRDPDSKEQIGVNDWYKAAQGIEEAFNIANQANFGNDDYVPPVAAEPAQPEPATVPPAKVAKAEAEIDEGDEDLKDPFAE